MSTPTSLAIRSFSDRAEALAHCILRAGEAPRLVAFDDAVGCPTETLLAALEWTRVVGILPDDDLLHAGRLTADTAAAVVEQRDAEGARKYVFLGPRLELPQLDPSEGEVVIDQPGVRSVAFGDRASALGHFLRTTLGAGAMIAQLGRRAPEMRHVRRWLGPIVHELDGPRRWIAGWFAVSSGGALFVGDTDDDTRYRYIEVGTEP